MSRGDIVSVVVPGAYGKPRPAIVIQSDFFTMHNSVTILPLTSDLKDAPLFRFRIEPSDGNGLKLASQVMVDKIATVPRTKIGGLIGRLERKYLQQIERLLAVWVGIG